MASAPANDSADNTTRADEVTPDASSATQRTGKRAGKKAAGQRGAGKRAGAKKGGPGKKAAGKKAAGKKAAAKRAAKKAAAASGDTAGRGSASMQADTRAAGAKKSFGARFGRKRGADPESEPGAGQGATGPAGRGAAKKGGKKSPAKKAAAKKLARRLVVREDESPWTPKELREVRSELQADAKRLQGEIAVADRDVRTLMRDNGDGAGNDQADVGSNTFERDHEMAIVAQHREMLEQVERALSRIRDGSYGICERCGNPIGKMRLMAFPRATLCVPCKQREERR